MKPDAIGDPLILMKSDSESVATEDSTSLPVTKTFEDLILADANINVSHYPYTLTEAELRTSTNPSLKVFFNALDGKNKPDKLLRILSTITSFAKFNSRAYLQPLNRPSSPLSDDLASNLSFASSSASQVSSTSADAATWLNEHTINPVISDSYNHGIHVLPEAPILSAIQEAVHAEYDSPLAGVTLKKQLETKLIFSNDGNQLYLLSKLKITEATIIPGIGHNEPFQVALGGDIYTLVKCSVSEENVVTSSLIAHATNSTFFKDLYMGVNSVFFDSDTLSFEDARKLVTPHYERLLSQRQALSSGVDEAHHLYLEQIQKKTDGLHRYLEQTSTSHTNKKAMQKMQRALKEFKNTIKLARDICKTQELYYKLKAKNYAAFYDYAPRDIRLIREHLYNSYTNALSNASRSHNAKASVDLKKAETLMKLLDEICDAQLAINRLKFNLNAESAVMHTMLDVIDRLKIYATKQVRKGTELNINKAKATLETINSLINLANENLNVIALNQQAEFAQQAFDIVEQHQEKIASSRFIDQILDKIRRIMQIFSRTKEVNAESRKRKLSSTSFIATEGYKVTKCVEQSIINLKVNSLLKQAEQTVAREATASSQLSSTAQVLASSASAKPTFNRVNLTEPAVYFDKFYLESGHFFDNVLKTKYANGSYTNSYFIIETNNADHEHRYYLAYVSKDYNSASKQDLLAVEISPGNLKLLKENLSQHNDSLTSEQADALRYCLIDRLRKQLEHKLLRLTSNRLNHEKSKFRGYIRDSLTNYELPITVINYFYAKQEQITISAPAELINLLKRYEALNNQYGEFIVSYENRLQELQRFKNRHGFDEMDLREESRPSSWNDAELPRAER